MHAALVDIALGAIERARPRKIRPVWQWAEEEIIIDGGPAAGPYRLSRSPWTGLFLREAFSGEYSCVATVGPTQSGKTLTSYIIPMLYHLFELREHVICGVPDLNMSGDKWKMDFLPTIRATRSYRDELPLTGAGSRDAQKIESVKFRNGAVLKFMTGGGRPSTRAGFTARVLGVTELDNFDRQDTSGKESSTLKQLMGRLLAYPERERVQILECTATLESGAIWQWTQHKGTGSRVAVPCGHCGEFIVPEMEHLTGWEEAEDKLAARDLARWCCYRCGGMIDDEMRRVMNRDGVIIHRGQEIDRAGRIHGERPRTNIFGFRYSAFHNLLALTGDVAMEMWEAQRDENPDDAKKRVRQQYFALPAEKAAKTDVTLTQEGILQRTGPRRRGIVRDDYVAVTAMIDVHKRHLTYMVMAWAENARGEIVDYGDVAFELGEQSPEIVLKRELAGLMSRIDTGYETESGKPVTPDFRQVDARYMTEVVEKLCMENGFEWIPSYGFGQLNNNKYHKPAGDKKRKVDLGVEWHCLEAPREYGAVLEMQFNADYWKSWAHRRLVVEPGQAGSVVLFHPEFKTEHLTLVQHLTAEEQEDVVDKDLTVKTVWKKVRRENHLLDAYTGCCVGAAALGVGVESNPDDDDGAGAGGGTGNQDGTGWIRRSADQWIRR